MKTHTLCLIISFIFLLSCSKDDTADPYEPFRSSVEQDLYNNSYIVYGSSSENGWTIIYYPNSSAKKSEGNYNNGIPSGNWKFFYPSGTLIAEGNFNNGIMSGNWKFFYPNGRIESEGNFNNGYKTGEWKYWLETGQYYTSFYY